jgi:hypothetical protein
MAKCQLPSCGYTRLLFFERKTQKKAMGMFFGLSHSNSCKQNNKTKTTIKMQRHISSHPCFLYERPCSLA